MPRAGARGQHDARVPVAVARPRSCRRRSFAVRVGRRRRASRDAALEPVLGRATGRRAAPRGRPVGERTSRPLGGARRSRRARGDRPRSRVAPRVGGSTSRSAAGSVVPSGLERRARRGRRTTRASRAERASAPCTPAVAGVDPVDDRAAGAPTRRPDAAADGRGSTGSAPIPYARRRAHRAHRRRPCPFVLAGRAGAHRATADATGDQLAGSASTSVPSSPGQADGGQAAPGPLSRGRGSSRQPSRPRDPIWRKPRPRPRRSPAPGSRGRQRRRLGASLRESRRSAAGAVGIGERAAAVRARGGSSTRDDSSMPACSASGSVTVGSSHGREVRGQAGADPGRRQQAVDRLGDREAPPR